MNVINANSQTVLNIGRQGEYGVTQVIFDLNKLIAEFGNGTAVLVHQPYSSSAYIVPPALGETYDGAVQDDDLLIWHIGQLATSYVGNGGAELRWYVEGKLKKSKIYDTQCIKALGETTVITDLQQSYIDQMAEIASAYVNIDSVPTQGSTNAVTSGGVYDAIQAGGWAWGDVQGGISTESANLLCDILGECLTGTDQTANIASLRALLTGSAPSPDPPVTIAYIVTNNLTNVSSSNSATSVNSGASYSATLTGDSGYLLTDATVTMGGTDITESAVSSTGRNTLNISIASVTGAVVITATAEAEEPTVTEVTMTNKGVIYDCAIYSDDGSTSLISAKNSTTYVSDETFAEDTQVTITITYGIANVNLKQWAASTLDTEDNKHGYYGVEIGYAQQDPYTATYTVKAGHKLMIKNYNSGSWQSMTVTK